MRAAYIGFDIRQTPRLNIRCLNVVIYRQISIMNRPPYQGI